jgi:YVTN family beta-propeller protein
VNPFLPSAGIDIRNWATVPTDMVTDGRSIWVADPNNPSTARVRRFMANADFRFSTSAAGAHRPTFAAVDGQQNGWVANVDNNTVVVINPDGGAIRTINVSSPGRMFFDGTNMWVVSGGLHVKKIDPSDGAELGTFLTNGITPGLMAFDGSHLWIVNHASSNIAKMRPADGVVLGTIPTSANVTGVAFDGTYLWIVNGSDNTVSIVRASDSVTVATVPTGTAPAGIAFDGTFMWVTNSGDHNATKFRVSDRAALGTIFTGQQPTKVVTAGGYLWILNSGSRSIFVYRLR